MLSCAVPYSVVVFLQDILNHLINDIEQFVALALAAAPKVHKKKKKKTKSLKGETLCSSNDFIDCIAL